MNFLSRFFTSNPVTFALGMGAGLVGLYLVNKSDEKRKFDKMMNEMEEMMNAMEMRETAKLEDTSKVAAVVA